MNTCSLIFYKNNELTLGVAAKLSKLSSSPSFHDEKNLLVACVGELCMSSTLLPPLVATSSSPESPPNMEVDELRAVDDVSCDAYDTCLYAHLLVCFTL